MVNQLIQDPNKLPKEYSVDTLLSGFSSLGLTKEVKALKQLSKINSDLTQILSVDVNIDANLMDIPKIKKLGNDIFIQGVHLFESALEVAQQANIGNLNELKNDSEELLAELTKARKGSSIYSLIKERLDKNQENIKLIKGKEDRVDELMMRADLCTDALRGIVLQLPELTKHESKTEFDSKVAELNDRVGWGMRVKAEYERQGL